MSETERNQRIADRICQDFQWDGQTFESGEYVALLDGKVVATADGLAQALGALRSVDPDPARGMIVEVAKSPVDVIRLVKGLNGKSLFFQP